MKRSVLPPRLALLVFGCLLSAAAARALPFTGRIGLLAQYDGDVITLPASDDHKDDSALHALAVAERSIVASTDNLVTFSGRLDSLQWRRYPGLGTTNASFTTTLRHRFGLGYEAPSLSADVSVGGAWARASDQGGLTEAAGIHFNHRPESWLAYGFSGDFDRIVAREGFYSRSGFTASASAAVIVLPRLSLDLELRQRTGGILSYGYRAYAWGNGYGAYAWFPSYPTDLFGPGYAAYAYKARTRGVRLTAHFALSERQAFDLGFDWSVSQRGPARYTSRVWSLGYLWMY